jgi:hypothetical protein
MRDQRESAERDSRNQEHAGRSYRAADGNDIADETAPDGLPWGSFPIGVVIKKGHETASRSVSWQDSDPRLDDAQLMMPYPSASTQAPRYDGRDGGSEPRYYTDSPTYYYDYDASGGRGSPTFPPPM